MNCKPGDLAVIVRSYAGNEGKIVRCLSFIPAGTSVSKDGYASEDGWVTDVPLRQMFYPDDGSAPFRIDDAFYAIDSFLRPIRDQHGEDEMIRIAGKPKEKERA